MAILPILIYGAPALRQKAKPVSAVSAAVLHRVIVMNPTEHQEPEGLVAIINPEIVVAEGELVAEEGCLSVPDVREEVARHRRVVVKGIGRDEKPLELEAVDLPARILQHEIDHLDGVLFIDRLSPAKKTLLKRQLKKRFLDQA